MIDIATHDEKVTHITCVAEGDSEVVKEGRARITIIISGLEKSSMLSKDTKLAIGVGCWTIDQKDLQESAIGSTVASPTPAAKFGRIVTDTSCVSSGRTGGQDSSAAPLPDVRGRGSGIEGSDSFGTVAVKPSIPTNTLFPRAMWASA